MSQRRQNGVLRLRDLNRPLVVQTATDPRSLVFRSSLRKASNTVYFSARIYKIIYSVYNVFSYSITAATRSVRQLLETPDVSNLLEILRLPDIPELLNI